jgi:uncharacterized protein
MPLQPRRLVESLTDELARLPTINDHSHVIAESERIGRDLDALAYFAHPYPAADLQSAGMTAEELAFVTTPGAASLKERWARFAPHWRHIRWTGFSECLLEGWQGTFGIGELTAETVGPLSEAIRAARRPGHYHEVLREKAKIAVSLVQMEDLVEVDRSLFLPMPRLNRFSMLRARKDVEGIERDYGVRLRTVEDLVGAIGGACVSWKAAGAPAIKLSQSYHRRMDFQERTGGAAERVFRSLMEGGYGGLDSEDGRVLEDYLVFACVRAATEAGLAVQFHVGPRAGTYGSLEGASLAPMAGLIRANRDARFDISHAGFPSLREAAVLAKTCGNVYLNMSWIHIYSPEACVGALREWVRMVPWNKILGFGDDLYWVDTIYGHLRVARRNVATALVDLMEERVLGEEDALEIARGLFYDNPKALYGLSELVG